MEKRLGPGFVALGVLASALAVSGLARAAPQQPPETCGDGVCDSGESWRACPDDCGLRARLRRRVQQRLRERVESRRAGGAAAGRGDHVYSLTHDGRQRTYLVHVPPSYDGRRPAPVVIVLHGGSGNAQGMQRMTLMNQAADRHGFLAVYPQGTGPQLLGKTLGSWNAEQCCPKAVDEHVDDVGFIAAMLEQLASDVAIDRSRMYATGHSNGAMLSYRLACELSEQIAAIAPVGAQVQLSNCAPTRPVPVIHFHGTDDPCALYDGGPACGGCMAAHFTRTLHKEVEVHTWPCESVPDHIARWRAINGVLDASHVTVQHGQSTCVTYGSDTPGEVTLCTIQGMGHTWPGGTYGPACDKPESKNCQSFMQAIGSLSDDLNADEVMWEFFQRHPLPERTRP